MPDEPTTQPDPRQPRGRSYAPVPHDAIAAASGHEQRSCVLALYERAHRGRWAPRFVTLRGLSVELGIPKSTIGRLLERLEADGLVRTEILKRGGRKQGMTLSVLDPNVGHDLGHGTGHGAGHKRDTNPKEKSEERDTRGTRAGHDLGHGAGHVAGHLCRSEPEPTNPEPEPENLGGVSPAEAADPPRPELRLIEEKPTPRRRTPLPAWAVKDKLSLRDVQAMTEVVAYIRGEAYVARRKGPFLSATDSSALRSLWRAEERPSMVDLCQDLRLVARAARGCRHKLFRVDIRQEVFKDGCNQSDNVELLCRHKNGKWSERLNIARRWEEYGFPGCPELAEAAAVEEAEAVDRPDPFPSLAALRGIDPQRALEISTSIPLGDLGPDTPEDDPRWVPYSEALEAAAAAELAELEEVTRAAK